MLHHELVQRVKNKEYYFMFSYAFLGFVVVVVVIVVVVVVVFHQKYFAFITFIFFLWNIKFPQHNINQSKTEIGDQKLSVELHAIPTS